MCCGASVLCAEVGVGFRSDIASLRSWRKGSMDVGTPERSWNCREK